MRVIKLGLLVGWSQGVRCSLRSVRENKAFLLLISLFLALRFANLLTSVEAVSWEEELYRGTIAKELIEGLKVSLWDYQADPYSGGSLVVGALTVPFFLLLGPNLFALKMVPLLFSLLALISLFLFLNRFFDPKIALLACSFYVFCPPSFTALSLVAMGFHTESVLLSVVMIFCFYRFLFEDRNRVFFVMLFGLLGGIGFSFTYITAITFLACLMTWCLLDRESFLGKPVLLFLGSVLVGLLPWIFYNATHGLGGLHYIDRAMRKGFLSASSGGWGICESPGRKFRKLAKLVLLTIPASFSFQSFLRIPGTALSFSYYCLVMLLFLPFYFQGSKKLLPILKDALKRGRVSQQSFDQAKTIPFLLYPLLFLFIYGASCLPANISFIHFMGSRYFAPLYLFAFPLMAITLRRNKRIELFLIPILALGVLGQGSLILRESFGRAFHYRGYSYFPLGELWAKNPFRFPEEFRKLSQRSEQFKDLDGRYFYWGLVKGSFWEASADGDFQMYRDVKRAMEMLEEVPPSYRPYFFEAWGGSFRRQDDNDFDHIGSFAKFIPENERDYFYHGLAQSVASRVPLPSEYLASIKRLDPRYQRAFYFTLGSSIYVKHWRMLNQMLEEGLNVIEDLGPQERAWVWRGIGGGAWAHQWYCLQLSVQCTDKPVDFILTEAPSNSYRDISWGIGWQVRASRFLEDRTRALDWIQRLPREVGPGALQGLEAFEKWYRIAPLEG